MNGKAALVTGSSRGIGAAIARALAARGAAVAVHGRDRQALDAVVAEIRNAGGRTTPVVADVTRFDEVEAMRQSVEGALGPVISSWPTRAAASRRSGHWRT